MNEAYVNKVYQDGDKEIHFPYWRQVLQNETTNFQTKSLKKEQENKQFINKDEIALKHPKTGSTIKLADDGSIEMFVNEDTGIRLDPKENAIIFYGDVFHLTTKEYRIHTKPYGFIWNNYNLNPYFYCGDKVDNSSVLPSLNITTSSGSKTLPLFQEQTRKTYFDEKTKTIMNDLGIKTSQR